MNYNQQQNPNSTNYSMKQQQYQTGQDWELFQSHSDPFNYPPMQRKNLMSLQTIQPYETQFYDVRNNTIRDANLNIGDIRGAQPKFKIQALNKPDLHNVGDIDGSQPKPHIQFTQYNKVSHILDHDDIQGSHPNINKFYTKREPFNPLEPKYKLQEAQQIIVDPPKFQRDTLYIDDIDGTRAKARIMAYDKQLPDIDGARPKQKFLPKDYIDSLNVKDINNIKYFEQNRCVNPLNPTYTWNIDENSTTSQQFGYIDGSNSRQLHKELPKPFDKYASTDIQGANAGSLIKKFNINNQYAYSNQDIQGTQANTRKIGIQTKRCLNPLRPDYQFPGRTESDNAYGGYAFSNQNQQQNQPRSQLAASASQNLIRANKHPVMPAQPQQLSYSQSIAHLPPKENVHHNNGNQQQGYLQPHQQQANIGNGFNQSELYQSSYIPEQQYNNQKSVPSQIDQQLQFNQIPQMFYDVQGKNNLPPNQQNVYQKNQ